MKKMTALMTMIVMAAAFTAEPAVKFVYEPGVDEMTMIIDLADANISQVADDSCAALANGRTPDGWGLEYYLEFGENGRLANQDGRAVYFCTEIGQPIAGQANAVKLTGTGRNGQKQDVDILLPGTSCRVTPFAIFDGKPCFLNSSAIWATMNGQPVANDKRNYRLVLPATP